MSQTPPSDLEAAVLGAARRLLDDAGPGFTMRQLAEEAGVSRATLYRLVGSRDAVLRRLQGKDPDAGPPDRSSATRARILDAANEVFGLRGFERATMEEIAARAGVSAMTVYRHFEGREGLVRALVLERSPRAQAREILAGDGRDLEGDLVRLTEAILEAVSRNAGLLQMMLGSSRSRWEEIQPLRESNRSTVEVLAAYLKDRVDEGRLQGDPVALTRAFMGMVMTFGYFEPQYLEQTRRDHAQTARFVVRLFLDGAREAR